jgi:hypothetical protein
MLMLLQVKLDRDMSSGWFTNKEIASQLLSSSPKSSASDVHLLRIEVVFADGTIRALPGKLWRSWQQHTLYVRTS